MTGLSLQKPEEFDSYTSVLGPQSETIDPVQYSTVPEFSQVLHLWLAHVHPLRLSIGSHRFWAILQKNIHNRKTKHRQKTYWSAEGSIGQCFRWTCGIPNAMTRAWGPPRDHHGAWISYVKVKSLYSSLNFPDSLCVQRIGMIREPLL